MISDDQFEIMLSVANSEFDYSDVDKDGKVNFEEFLSWHVAAF
jgi:hypothetical protein